MPREQFHRGLQDVQDGVLEPHGEGRPRKPAHDDIEGPRVLRVTVEVELLRRRLLEAEGGELHAEFPHELAIHLDAEVA